MLTSLKLCIVSLACAVTLSSYAVAQTISRIEIQGNQRIEASTIQNYLKIRENAPLSPSDLDAGLKRLYETGFFADITIEENAGTLVVTVAENPSINEVAFEGNDRIGDDDLAQEVSLNARALYTRTKLQNDVKRLLDVYRRSGRYSAKIEPKVIMLEQNRMNLVYEIDEGPVSRIERINFIGNKAFNSGILEEVISSSENRWWQFITDTDIYDADRVLYDQELLRRFYLSEGYADFRVDSGIAELTPDQDAFYITYTITEGDKYEFGEVDVASSLQGSRRPDFDADITTFGGERYNSSEIETTIDNMVKTLGNEGFAFVDIDPKVERNVEDKIIDLTYQVKEGPRVYIERINIEGNSRTLDRVIRREFRFSEGDPYNASKLKRSEQRLNNLGYFEKVEVTTEPGSAPDRTVVNVLVEEQSTGEISIGAGFSTVDGALADFGISERNLLGRGQNLRFRSTLAVERTQFDVGFTEPYFLGRDLSAGFDLFQITQDFGQESSFDRESIGGTLRMSYSLAERLRHRFFYSYDQNEITNIDDNASRFIRDQEGENLTSMIGHSLIYDDRNNRFDPTDGWFWRFNQDFAGVGGDDVFLRHELQSEYYIPVTDDWTLSFAGSGGHMFALEDDIRINQRFFLGGRQMRGFDNAGIGPRDITTDDALGGEIYYTASAEVKFPLGLPNELGIQGALFVDAGSLWELDDSGPEVADDVSTRVAVGFGLAWRSPFGPIRVDFGFPVMKEDYDVEENFRFNFGTRF